MEDNPDNRFLLLLRSFKRRSREAPAKTFLRLEYAVIFVALLLLAVFVSLVLQALKS